MIDCKKALIKSTGKNETRYGMSVVIDLSENIDVIRSIYSTKNSIPKNISKWFIWTEDHNYHLTILRCKSIYSDFSVNMETTEFIKNTFQNKCAFSISATLLRLDRDGIIRLYFNNIPSSFYNDIDMLAFSTVTGLQYQLITNPWITFAYASPKFINDIASKYFAIVECLEKVSIKFQLNVNLITIVKYYDNAFRKKNTVLNIALGGL